MKGILEFELPMEESEHQDAAEGTLWKGVVFKSYEYIRRQISDGHFETPEEALIAIRDFIFSETEDHNLNIYR